MNRNTFKHYFNEIRSVWLFYEWKIKIVIVAFEFRANDAESEMGQIKYSSAKAYANSNEIKFDKWWLYIPIKSKNAGSSIKSIHI